MSGVRHQFLEEAHHHAADFGQVALEGLVLVRPQVTEVLGQQEVVIEFAGGAEGNVEEAGELGPAIAAAAFGDVGANGRAGPSDLAGEPTRYGRTDA